MRSVSILGCGWLGLPLAVKLKEAGFSVKGSTTRHEKLALLELHQIEAHVLDISQQPAASSFFNSEVLIVAVPPKRRTDGGTRYLIDITALAEALKHTPVDKVVLISTTAVYADTKHIVFESDAMHDHALVAAENVLLRHPNIQTTVVRFAGLIGPGRHPAKFFPADQVTAVPNTPVNMISGDDCINVLLSIINQDAWGEVFNACADEHPFKSDFYAAAARCAGTRAPVFINAPSIGKIVNCDKIKTRLNFRFTNLFDTLESLPQIGND